MKEQENTLRLAKEAGFGNYAYEAASMFEKFSILVKADFLEKSAQYITNDATREACIAEAVAETREACAKLMEENITQDSGANLKAASLIRAMGAAQSSEGEA